MLLSKVAREWSPAFPPAEIYPDEIDEYMYGRGHSDVWCGTPLNPVMFQQALRDPENIKIGCGACEGCNFLDNALKNFPPELASAPFPQQVDALVQLQKKRRVKLEKNYKKMVKWNLRTQAVMQKLEKENREMTVHIALMDRVEDNVHYQEDGYEDQEPRVPPIYHDDEPRVPPVYHGDEPRVRVAPAYHDDEPGLSPVDSEDDDENDDEDEPRVPRIFYD